MHPSETTDASFQSDVIESQFPVLVDFWAPWCGPCRMVAPVVEELAREYDGRVKFVKLNTDENPGISAAYRIRSLPTLLLFKDGQPVSHVVGARPKEDIEQRLVAALAS